MEATVPEPFTRLRARWLLACMILSTFLGIGVTLPFEIDEAWEGVSAYLWMDLFLVAGLWWMSHRSRLVGARLVGDLQADGELLRLLWIVLPLIVLAYGSVWLVYYPLSFVVPGFVEWWVLDTDFLLIVDEDGELPLAPNAVNFLLIVVLAPVIEEWFFRGLLLHRWSYKWGVRTGVVLSSLVFGVLHADLLGAFLFGIAMAALYVQTGRLIVPIAAHALNNALAWGLGFVELSVYGGEYGIEDFQSEWWLGLGCLILVLPWTIHYFRRHWPSPSWSLPYSA